MKKFSVDYYHNLNEIKTNFEVALSKMELVSGISKIVFDDFPANLPPDLADQFKSIIIAVDAIHKVNDSQLQVSYSKNEKLLFHFMIAYFAAKTQDTPLTNAFFYNTINAQQLVILLAHYNAFLTGLAKIFFKYDPRTMFSEKLVGKNNKKKITVKKILEKDTIDEIRDLYVEEKAEEFKSLNVHKQIVTLMKINSKIVKYNKNELEQIKYFAEVRNCIIHNNSKADQYFLDQIGIKDISVGDEVIIDDDELTEFIWQTRKKLNELHETAIKFIYGEEWPLSGIVTNLNETP